MYLETAIEATRLGGRIITENLADDKRKQASKKQQFDFVTEVDYLAEKAILKFIRERHPEHRILAEETGGEKGNGDFLWIIDPLDGTTNYIHGFPVFSVSVALMNRDEVVIGAILDPLRDELFHAEKGKGAFLNGHAISVSQNQDLSKCLLATGFPFRAKHLSDPYFDALIRMFHKISDFRRAGSAALDLAYVACGRLDGFWEVTLNRWDIAAGILLIEEAGGKVTDIWGGNTHLQTGHIAASNGPIHGEITQIAGRSFKDINL